MRLWMITTTQYLSGIVKIASKMGISTIQSYQGSQIFEAIGISEDVIDEVFHRNCELRGRNYPGRISQRMWTSATARLLIPWD